MGNVVKLHSVGAVSTATISRPDALNALNQEVLRELKEVLAQVERDRSVRVLILTGAGKAFVAGADIREMNGSDAEGIHRYIELGQGVMNAIESLPIPVIAKVNGFALGGGLELALACDAIFASSQAKVGQPEVNLGIIPGFGGTQRLTRRAGVGVAKRLILSGEILSAEEAFQLGVVEKVTSPDTLDAEVQKFAELIASKGPAAVAEAKRILNRAPDSTLAEGLSAEVLGFERLFGTSDRVEGMSAFFEKRVPKFSGK